jgi:hypothetical protein
VAKKRGFIASSRPKASGAFNHADTFIDDAAPAVWQADKVRLACAILNGRHLKKPCFHRALG